MACPRCGKNETIAIYKEIPLCDDCYYDITGEHYYIYIIITNYNPFDFQSMVIKYKSWDKFIEDIQDINCTEFVKGTMNGKLHHNNTYAIIDFKDEFHAKYHYNDEFHKDSYVYACPVDKNHMKYVVNSKI